MSVVIPRVVVAGGGVAALEAVLALLERAPALALELVAADTHFVNRPLSVLEPFGAGVGRSVPLSRLADRGVTLTRARVAAVDPERRLVVCGDGSSRPYDALLVALGARPARPFEHALTFRGPRDGEALHGLVQDLEAGHVHRVAFVAAEGVAWTMPLYELALQTAARARMLALPGVEVTVVTPEERPLELFGRTGAALAECLLEEAGITLVTGARPAVPGHGRVAPAPGAPLLEVDRVVTLPRLEGLPVGGLPVAPDGFLPTTAGGRVAGLERVYAAGDGTSGTVKQGGLAAQQADRAVDTLLADLGVPAPGAEDGPPQLRAVLMTSEEVWYLRREEGAPDGEVSRRPLWWPPSKLAGRRLAAFLEPERGGGGGWRGRPARRRAPAPRGALRPLEPRR